MEITAIVKLISLVLAAAFAILGTLTSYKNDDGNVTRWGRVAIIGVIISGLLSAVLLGFEESNRAADKNKAVDEKIIAQDKTNAEQEKLNEQFSNLVKKAEDNIEQTTKTLEQTDKVAQDVKNSIETQQKLSDQTKSISNSVEKNLQGQTQLLTQSKVIAGTLESSVNQQAKTFRNTQELQQQQSVVLQNTLRSITSFKQFKVKYSLKFPLDYYKLHNFKNNLINHVNTDSVVDGIYTYGKGNKITAISIHTNSPYFLLIKQKEKKEVVEWLNESNLRLGFYKGIQDIKLAKKVDLIIETYAKSYTKELEQEIVNWEFKNSSVSQAFGITVILSKTSRMDEGIYLNIETNVIRSWENETHKIMSFSDLPDSLFSTEIPCESKLVSFEFQTGEGYGTKYSLPKKGQEFKSTVEGFCEVYYVLEKTDFGFF